MRRVRIPAQTISGVRIVASNIQIAMLRLSMPCFGLQAGSLIVSSRGRDRFDRTPGPDVPLILWTPKAVLVSTAR